MTSNRRALAAAVLAVSLTACGGPMTNTATDPAPTPAREVAAARLENIAAETPSTVAVLRSVLRASNYPRAAGGAIVYPAVVESVHDGDSLRVVAIVREALTDDTESARLARVTIRLAGINTPELNDPNPDVRARAKAARDRLRVLLPDGALVEVADRGREKYGRTLVDVTPRRGGSVAATLIAEGHGKPYTGGPR